MPRGGAEQGRRGDLDINVSVVVTVGSQLWYEDAPSKCELPCTGIVQNWHGTPHKVRGVSNLGRLQENRMCSELHGLSECNLLPLDMETPRKLHSSKVQQRLEPQPQKNESAVARAASQHDHKVGAPRGQAQPWAPQRTSHKKRATNNHKRKNQMSGGRCGCATLSRKNVTTVVLCEKQWSPKVKIINSKE